MTAPSTATAPTLGPQVDVDEFTRDRWEDGHPPLVIRAEHKALRAELVVRTAYELYRPEAHPSDALMWATDLRRVAAAYGVPLTVASNYIHVKACDLALSWRRTAEQATA